MTTATKTKKPTPPASPVDAHQKQIGKFQKRIEDKASRDEADEQANRTRIRERLERGDTIADVDLPEALDIQRTELLPAAQQAELKAQRDKCIRAVKGTAGQMRQHIEPAAEALETLATHLTALRPLCHKFSAQVRELGGTVPHRFGTGQQFEWAVVTRLHDAWQNFLNRPPAPHSVRKFAFGELTLLDVDNAVAAVSRERNRESTQ